MKDEIRKIIHHEISQKNVVKFSLIYVPPALFGNKTVKNLTITEVLWLIWICVREVFDAQVKIFFSLAIVLVLNLKTIKLLERKF